MSQLFTQSSQQTIKPILSLFYFILLPKKSFKRLFWLRVGFNQKKKKGRVTGQPVFVSDQKMGSGRVRNTTKNVSFSCIFLSGVDKNVAIEWLWAAFGKNATTPVAFTKCSPKISSIAAFFYVWVAFLWVGLRPCFKNAAINPSDFFFFKFL